MIAPAAVSTSRWPRTGARAIGGDPRGRAGRERRRRRGGGRRYYRGSTVSVLRVAMDWILLAPMLLSLACWPLSVDAASTTGKPSILLMFPVSGPPRQVANLQMIHVHVQLAG